MYVRLGFAVAVHVDPDVLLVDEVLAVGDEAFAHRCLRRIEEFLSAGKTVLMVSHSLSLMEEMCDRIMVLEPGRQPDLRAWTEPEAAAVLDLCNVRYLLAPAGGAASAVPPPLEEVFTGRRDAVLWRPGTLPRAFFPRRIEVVADADEALARLAAGGLVGREVAYLEVSDPEFERGPPTGSARAAARSSGHAFELSVQASGPGYLVVSVLPYPGLRAEIERDGSAVPAQIIPANAAMCAVAVPRGRCRVRFVYQPVWGGFALALRVVGALTLLLLAVMSVRNPAPPD